MQTSNFVDIQEEFMARVSAAVYCIVATVDRQNRPRTRIMHPIWHGPTGWVISWPESHKANHLAHNPHVSLAYWHEKEKPVYVEAVAEWIDGRSIKQQVWELHQTIPPPLGFDPEPHYGTIDHHFYGVLKFTPWRIEVANLWGESLIWRKSKEAEANSQHG